MITQQSATSDHDLTIDPIHEGYDSLIDGATLEGMTSKWYNDFRVDV